MMGFTDLTTNIDTSRNKLRRIARHDDQEFSNQSIWNAMEKFVNTVNVMDETILVPSRLLDRQVGDSVDTILSPPETPKHLRTHNKKKTNVRDLLHQSDLFNLYNMLNSVKVDLLWGRNGENAEDDEDVATPVVESVPLPPTQEENQTSSITTTSNNNNNITNTDKDAVNVAASEAATATKGHTRRPSTVSMISTNSAASTISDSESDISNENDSGIESETNQERDKSVELAKQFRQHLHGLYMCLEQMTDASNYLTARYQSDVGPV